MNQVSKSHTEDALGGHSKASQKPKQANLQPGTTSTNIDEAKGGAKKVKPKPAHVGPWNVPGEEKETIRQGAFPNRSQEGVKVASPGRVQQARKNGPIGSQIDSQGNNNAAPKKHSKTGGGNHGGY